MDRKRQRLSLDDPIFSDRLRGTGGSLGYERRSVASAPRSMQDIGFRRPVKPLSGKSSDLSGVAPAVAKPTPVAAAIPQEKRPVGQLRRAQGHVLAHAPQKSRVLARKAVAVPRNSDEKPASAAQPARKRPVVLYAMAGALFVIGLVVSLNGFRSNRQVAAQVKHLTATSQSSDGTASTAPATSKPSTADVAGYYVAPNLPRYIDIPKLAVHARIKSMGVNTKNQLQAPGNVYDAGWYNASAQPGQPGAMLLDGHISSWTTPGVFYGLNKLVSGDTITITRGDGKKFEYVVVKTATVDAKVVDMSSLLVSSDTAKPGLNLISCAGDVIPGSNEFDKRITVYTTMR